MSADIMLLQEISEQGRREAEEGEIQAHPLEDVESELGDATDDESDTTPVFYDVVKASKAEEGQLVSLPCPTSHRFPLYRDGHTLVMALCEMQE